MIVLPATGYWMIFSTFGGFAQVGLYVHVMQVIGIVMILIFLHVFFAPYQRLNRAISSADWTKAGQQLGQIRVLVGINLVLGLVTTVFAAAGAYFT